MPGGKAITAEAAATGAPEEVPNRTLLPLVGLVLMMGLLPRLALGSHPVAADRKPPLRIGDEA
jgi:hypothetical protein